MMISKQQAHAAAVDLRTQGSNRRATTSVDVSPELLAAALAVVEGTPDTSAERLAEAELYLASDHPDSRVVASMMIQRIISDSLR
jgi:hypothetical protein